MMVHGVIQTARRVSYLRCRAGHGVPNLIGAGSAAADAGALRPYPAGRGRPHAHGRPGHINDVVYDLGSGDGRIVITAAKKYGARRRYRYRPGTDGRIAAERARGGRDGLVEFRRSDILQADVSKATVVTLYLVSSANLKLRPLLTRQLRSREPRGLARVWHGRLGSGKGRSFQGFARRRPRDLLVARRWEHPALKSPAFAAKRLRRGLAVAGAIHCRRRRANPGPDARVAPDGDSRLSRSVKGLRPRGAFLSTGRGVPATGLPPRVDGTGL